MSEDSIASATTARALPILPLLLFAPSWLRHGTAPSASAALSLKYSKPDAFMKIRYQLPIIKGKAS
jgi:hypothetical protein